MIKRRLFRLAAAAFVLGELFFSPCRLMAQRNDWRSFTDQQIRLADSLSLISQFTFHLKKFDHKNRPIREAWHYTIYQQHVIIFEVHYFQDSIEHDEVYYLNKDELLCMEEYEVVNPFTDDDEILWGSVGFFASQELRQHITMGKNNPPSAYSAWDAYRKFRGRYKELLENRTLIEGKGKEVIFVP